MSESSEDTAMADDEAAGVAVNVEAKVAADRTYKIFLGLDLPAVL